MDHTAMDRLLIEDTIAARRRRRRRGLIVLLLSLSITSLGAGAFSLALFTDQETVGANAFDTGTIDLTVSPASALVTLSDMFPGDTVTGSLLVSNGGTGQLRYSMTTSTSGDAALAAALTLDVKTLGTSCATFDGTDVVTSAPLSGPGNGFGSATGGPDSGDRTLTVAPAAGSSETLCFRVSLPIAADNTVQGLSTTATFTFDAEQTKNNP